MVKVEKMMRAVISLNSQTLFTFQITSVLHIEGRGSSELLCKKRVL